MDRARDGAAKNMAYFQYLNMLNAVMGGRMAGQV